MADTPGVLDWLADGARSAAGPDQVLAELCERLTSAGLPLARVAVFVQTLHPDIMGRAFLWRPGAPVRILEAGYALLDDAEYTDNPTSHVHRTGETIRRRLADPACTLDFPLLREFKADGITDYYAAPLRFTNGEIHVVSFVRRQNI